MTSLESDDVRNMRRLLEVHSNAPLAAPTGNSKSVSRVMNFLRVVETLTGHCRTAHETGNGGSPTFLRQV